MEVGIVGEVFKLIFGDPDVMNFILGFTISITFFLIIVQIFNSTRD